MISGVFKPHSLLPAAAFLCFLFSSGFSATATNLIVNGDFESGGLSGWTIFTTPNGDLGSYAGLPQVSLFDVAGNGSSSTAAMFQVGEAVWIAPVHTDQGGGIFQSFNSPAGLYSFHASIAA